MPQRRLPELPHLGRGATHVVLPGLRLARAAGVVIPVFVHHTVGWDDPMSLLLLIGGLLGGLAHGWLAEQVTWSRRTVYDVLVSGAVAVIAPASLAWFAHIELIGPPVFLISFGFCVGLSGNYVLIAALWKFGVFKDDPRAFGPRENKP